MYVAFNQSDSYVSRSHDGGETFLAPVQTSDDGRYWFHSAGAVAPNGDVYFAAAHHSQDHSGATHINALRSTDSGVSWTTTQVDTSAEAPDCSWSDGCYDGFLGPSVGLAVDASGLVMIAYNRGAAPGQAQKLWVRTSSNGIDWSAAQELSSPESGIHNGYPAVGASRTLAGDFRVVWQDDREQSETGWNTRMPATSWRRRPGDSGAPYKSAAGYAFVYGDYLELAVDGSGTNHVIWGEGTSYTGPGGTRYTRGVALSEPSGALPLLAGLGLVHGLRGLRARRGGSPRAGSGQPSSTT